MSKTILLHPGEEDFGQRIDSYISDHIDELTRSAVQRLLEQNFVLLGGKPLKKSDRIASLAEILILVPDAAVVDLRPENIQLDIIFEDDDIIVINKPQGMVVHPAAGNWSGTLVNALMFHCGSSLSGINGELRPGIVHRIDKDTSGLLVVAKNDQSHQFLADKIFRHEVRRSYQAIVIGSFKDSNGTINKPIGRHPNNRKRMAIVQSGKTAITHYSVIKRYVGYSHISFELETGRTHQIRVHMESVGHPIIGDPVYGNPKDRFHYLNGQCLHASKLEFLHPRTKQMMCFHAPLPLYFNAVIAKLETQNIQ